MQALRLGFNASIESFKKVKREAGYMREQLRHLEQHIKDVSKRNAYAAPQLQARLNAARDEQKVITLFVKLI
jgi:outer membrane protein assembly factor BamA